MNFLGRSESEAVNQDMAGQSGSRQEEEMDESLLDDTEEESIAAPGNIAVSMDSSNSITLLVSKAGNSSISTVQVPAKESAESSGSVGSLATDFMKSVKVGNNEVFAEPKNDSRYTNQARLGGGIRTGNAQHWSS